MIDRKPAAIARCLGVADVAACVRFAAEKDVPLSIKGGGHNIAGLAVCDGGLTLDTSLMKGVWVDPRTRTARAQAGCLLGDVDRETQLHGLAAVLGFVSNTGIAGLTLGGGFGYLTRRFGLTSDTVRSMEVVTAEGKVVRAAADESEDLFWGLRGGGGNFGVVTGFEYELQQVGPEITGGAIAWRGDEAPQVLEKFRELMADAPPELMAAVVLRKAPPAPWLPPDVHGQPVAVLALCHTGSEKDGQKAAEKIRAFAPAVGDVVQRRPYVTQQALLDATQPKGRRYYWKSEYLPAVSAEAAEAALAHWSRIPSPHGAVIFFPVDGGPAKLPEDHSAAGNRDAAVVLNITASWDAAADDGANVEWARAAWRDMRRFSTGGTYINFQTEDEGDDRVRAAYGGNWDRLVAIKSKWDPRNVFRVNKNVAPREAS
jgi:FAD/FMN-containing dehydrogenase